jgi:hypothetical protein
VVLDPAVLQALESACDKWPGTEIAWEAIEWVLAHDPLVGRPLNEDGSLRAFIYDGANSIKQPDIEVTYTINLNEIVVKITEFRNAKATYSGKG